MNFIRKNFSVLLLCAFVAFLFFWVRGGNFDQLWMQRWAILLTGCALFTSYKVGREVSWFFAPITFTTLFSGITASYWFNRYSNKVMEGLAVGISKAELFTADDKWAIQAVLRQDSSRALATFLLLFLVIRNVQVPTAAKVRTFIGTLGMIEAFLIIVQHKPSAWVPYFDNPSMGASFVVLSMFILWADISHYFEGKQKKLLMVGITVIGMSAVLATRASTPILALVAGVCSFILADAIRLERKALLWFLVPGALLPITFGIISQGASSLFHDNDRFNMWHWAVEYWYRQDTFTHLFGFGTGTMRALMPLAEVEHGMSTGWYFWLHNDWLQVLPEQGVLGFLSLLLAGFELFRRTIKWPEFSAMLGCFGAIMLTGFPLHWPVFVVALGLIARPFLENKETYDGI